MKIALILPYFGHFDNLFPLWLETCRWNKDIDWLLFTDDKRGFDYPENVKVSYMDFDDLKSRIQELYDFQITLDAPYRICNFRPAFGEVFQRELEGYDAWGFCDNDMLFGNISNFVPNVLPKKYKIGAFGHMSIIPNTEEVRHIYRYAEAYRMAFAVSNLLFFDENAFPHILEKNCYEIIKLHIADLKPRLWTHNVLKESGREWMNKAHCFVWNEGRLWRYYVDNTNVVVREEYAYIHFLKRPMVIETGLDLNKPLVIIPNKIINMDLKEISVDFLKEVSRPKIFWAYWKNSFRPKVFIERLTNRLYRNKNNRKVIAKMNEMIKHEV